MFHVQIHRLTLDHMTVENATTIGNAIGMLVEVDVDPQFGIACKKFIRMKVEIDINKPLKQGFWLPRDYSIDT